MLWPKQKNSLGESDFMMSKKEVYIGLMSGTSVDGIDAAAVEISGGTASPKCSLLAFENAAYGDELRSRIFELFDPKTAGVDKLGEMNFVLGEAFADAALSVMKKAGLSPSEVTAIGSHGQTVFHSPASKVPYTVQLGEGSVIAQRTGVTCVSDFRTADIAVGGNGAPLVPFTEFAMFRSDKKSLLLQNIGGISNVTVLPKGCKADEVFAFDNGPGNMLIDGIVSALSAGALRFDDGGRIAESGTVNEGLLNRLLEEPYYSLLPPKTTGRELFGSEYVKRIIESSPQLSMQDLVATVTFLTAKVIADSYARFVKGKTACDEMIVSGGGSFNLTLMKFLKRLMLCEGVRVYTGDEMGINSDAKEAVAFALLAFYTMNKCPNNLPCATGAKRSAVLGKISYC